MAGNKKPNIVPTRIKMSIPQGYMLGRTSPGVGPVELIPIAGGAGQDITNAQKATGQLPSGGGGAVAQIGACEIYLAAGGQLAGNQFYDGSVCPANMTFPSASLLVPSRATCRIAPTISATLHIVNDFATYSTSGYPNGTAATVAFTAGSTTGVITWLTPPKTMPQGGRFTAVLPPTFNDTAMEGVSILLVGDYVNG